MVFADLFPYEVNSSVPSGAYMRSQQSKHYVIWTGGDFVLIRKFGTSLSEIWIKIQQFIAFVAENVFKHIICQKVSSQLFRLVLDVLIDVYVTTDCSIQVWSSVYNQVILPALKGHLMFTYRLNQTAVSQNI